MQQIIQFFIRNKTNLLYLLLLFIAVIFTIQSHSYHKSKFINSANFITGGVYNSANNVSIYFNLESQNILLQEENARLNSIYHTPNDTIDNSFINDTVYSGVKYKFTPAQVIKNSYSAKNNVLLINRGKRDSMKQDFGVVTPKGILGIVDQTSTKFATVLSILNTNIKISAQLKNSNHFGSLMWNTKSPQIVQLNEISKIAPVKKGDTIVTSGRSVIFPKGIPIGVIKDYRLDSAENFYTIDVKLFNDMTNIEYVYIIENIDKDEINSLLKPNNE
ncbi:rod shape-determining protein MreC [Bizionia argentinensis JUB59]|uniref:Cell shape-determining protein MreC n=1 Tax=Bizionia argentinensis JUB59 TaxID=1046627 RepID=G2EDH7_9FLAO|nr:rod shape-determining protein MreC [Bizionia argentinensis]EGV43519.1 rod shape-determining protein MreC [Bizionia argentinensis JUB59]